RAPRRSSRRSPGVRAAASQSFEARRKRSSCSMPVGGVINTGEGSMKKIALLLSHLLVGAAGFALGVYLLPILIAPTAPSADEVSGVEQSARFSGQFRRDLKDSDALH